MRKKIPPSWFAKQETSSDSADAIRRRQQLLEQLPGLMDERKDRGRANQFAPYLLIRSVLGDRGDRNINAPFWESPDIWTAAGTPAATPARPPDHGGTIVAGQPNTVYAHIWNLGLAPLAGVCVEFYWFNPTFVFDTQNANLIGKIQLTQQVLAGRGMPGSHMLVKCPDAWVPVYETAGSGHECLVARVSGYGDPVGGNEWDPSHNRHVGQRNVWLVETGAQITGLIRALNATKPRDTHLQLIQLGPNEGKLPVQLVAPSLRVSPRISTQLLAERTALGEVTVLRQNTVPPAMLASVHEKADGVDRTPPVLPKPGEVAVIDPIHLFRGIEPAGKAHGAHSGVAELFAGVGRLQTGAAVLGAPPPGEAYVLRIAAYSGTQLAGGYTLVIKSQSHEKRA